MIAPRPWLRPAQEGDAYSGPASFARLLLAASLFVVLAAPAVAQPCPENAIYFVPPGPDPVFAADPIRSLGSGWDLGRGYARYDLVAGKLSATSIGDPSGGFGAHVRASDRYVLLGPVGAPPISFSVRLYVTGTAQGRNDGYLPTDVGSATVSAALIETGGAQDSANVTANPGQLLGFNPTLEIPLTHEVGQPFEITMALHSQGGFSTGMLGGKLSFIVPLGCAIVSCQGFAGSGATPVAKSTWGRLKEKYR